MRRLILLSGLLAVMTTACQEQLLEGNLAGQGEVEIALSSEGHIKPLMTRSEEESVPDAADFMVEIYSSSGIRLYRDTYANSSGKRIRLNSGDYRLLAQHGDSAGVGFNAVWFAADKEFTVHPQTHESVEAVAKMSKVKVAVEFGAQMAIDYPDYYVEITSDRSELLKFKKDETRSGYMPAGTFTPLVYAVIDGELKYYKASPVECQPNDFVTFSIDTKPLTGLMTVSVMIDNGTELIEKDLTIPSEMLPKDEPVISVNGFDGGYTVEMTEAVTDSPVLKTGLRADIVAKARIESCVMTLNGIAGLPESVDLCSLSAEDREMLSSAGLEWLGGMKGQRLGYVDFTGLASYIANSHCDPQALKGLSFSLTVTDELGRSETTETYSITEVAPSISFDVQPWNYYARRIDHLTASVNKGNADALEVQCFINGEWVSATRLSTAGNQQSFAAVTGLEPSTEYPVRAIYNDNENFVVEYSHDTESAAQVGNARFEDWQILSYEYTTKLLWSSKAYRDWYLPYAASETSPWWSVNSKQTMPIETMPEYQDFKCRPTVSYSTSPYSGKSSALIATIKIGSGANALGMGSTGLVTAAGELFIGEADERGNHIKDGHDFTSRPDVIKFMYKYDAYSNETFAVDIWIKSSDGTVIASESITDGSASQEWSEFSVPVGYSDNMKKANEIYISLRSTSSSSPATEKGRQYECAGSMQTACVGSILQVDDIELIYE